jgi:hypothetical protein
MLNVLALINYQCIDYLLFPIFCSAPTKRRSQSGSTSAVSLLGLESPCSSRASVAGSNTSDVWSTTSGSTVWRGLGSNGGLGRGGLLAGNSVGRAFGDFFNDDDNIDEVPDPLLLGL